MKVFNYLLFFCLFFCFYSCNDDANNGNDSKEIRLSSYDISLWAGKDTLISILDNPSNYKITTDKKEIASAEIANNKIHITTNEVGNVTLHLSDDQEREAEIKVKTTTFEGGWKVTQSESLAFLVIVETDDDTFSSILHDEILLKAQENTGTIYSFMKNENKLTVKYTDKENIEGEFSFQNLQLSLKYNDLEEVYHIKPFSPRFVQVLKDQTSQYQTIYPTKGVTKVQILEYWVMITI